MIQPQSRFNRFHEPLRLMITVSLHLLLMVAVVQAWMTAWPGKFILTAGVVLLIGASIAAWTKWRTAPLVIGAFGVAAIFLWPAIRYGSDAGGLRIAGLPFGTATAALIIVALGIAAWQLWKLASNPRLPRWVRFIPLVFALYAIALIVLGIARGAPSSGVLSGEGPVPWWISGSYLGSALLLPLGLIVALVTLVMILARKRTGALAAAAILLVMFSAFALSGLELTRNGRPNIAQFIVPAGYSATSSAAPELAAAGTGASTGITASLGANEASLAPFEGKDIDEIFARVATGVRFEPYSGVLRGAMGTAIARSGNSADQSMLLVEVLRRAGYRARFARGTLADNNIDAVIRGMYPPGIAVEQLGPEYAPYDPAADTELRQLVRDHVWVEVFQGDDKWLPLDPSFPRAKIGEAYSDGGERFDTPAEGQYQRIEATIKAETVGGQSQELGRFAGNVADLALKPISLVVRSVPQSAAGEEAGQTMGGPAAATDMMGGALGGATEAPKPAEPPKKADKQIVGVAYVRDLSVAGVPQKVQRTTVRNGNAGSALRREWIEFNVTGPGIQPRRVDRVLYEADEKTTTPALERRYTISVLPGRISRSFADEQTALANSLVNVKDLERRAQTASRTSADDPAVRQAASELAQVGDALGTVAGHLLSLRFAAESDSISRLIADGTGVSLAWAAPRILITGIEITGTDRNRMDAKVSLDLRLDEVRAYPYPGAPAQVTSVFQTARGIQESVIEGRLVALATGKGTAANTAQLISAAEKQRVPLVVINSSSRSRLNEIAPGVPANCVQMMDAAIAKGREVIVPSRAIAMEGGGQARWGWWEVDPASGQVIGVMQSGEHQGMVEYSVSSEEIGLNDESAQILGMMMGSVGTVGTLSALLLKYGTVTPELIKELEAYVSDLLCNSCFESISAKVTASGPGVGGSVGNECYTASKKFGGKVEVGGELKVGFCEAYSTGFKCSSGMILRALKNQAFIDSKASISFPSLESEAKVGCKDVN